MPGVDLINGWLHVSKTDNPAELHNEVERMRWIGADVEYWPVERVRDQLRSPRYFGAVHYRQAFHIDPYNYALGLAALAEKAGARIFEDLPAISLDPAGVRKRIVTPAGRCGPRTWCSPAMSTSAYSCRAWQRPCCPSRRL